MLHVQVVAAVGPVDGGVDGALVEQLAERGLVDDVRELVRREYVAEVDQRARHRGHRDSVADGHVAPVQASVRLDAHAGEPAFSRGEYVGVCDSAAPELHMNCGSEGGEVDARSACQDRGHPLAHLREPRLADRVHAPVPAVQASVRRALCDCRVPEAGLYELGGRDHAVLTGRDRRDPLVRRGG
jgi:hypothetical protein